MFPFQITDRGVTVFIDSKPRQFANTHSQYELITSAIHAGDWSAVRTHTDVAKSVELRTDGRVRIENDCIFVNEKQIHGNIVDRILAMIAMKSEAVKGLIRFLDRVYDNCSLSTIENVFDFIEACDLPITEDGCFLAYKYVREDFTDCYSGKFDNSVGSSPRMPRNECDDRRDVTCSTGLHVCSLEYLSGWYNRNIIVCKVAPEDVVCVPTDYNMAKMRTEGYTVVDTLKFSDGERIGTWYDDKYDDKPEVEDTVEEDVVEDTVTVEEDVAVSLSPTIISIHSFDAGLVELALKAIGADATGIIAYLEVLDDELTDGLEDYNVEVIDNGDVLVQIWHFGEDDDLDSLDIIIKGEEVVDTPKQKSDTKKGSAKLTVVEVRQIKALKSDWTGGKTTLTAIGKMFGVHREQIARIFRGETWKDVT